jgi:multidrug resistance efflux pump
LTGIVTTDEVIVSPEIQGRLQQLFVREGDAVTNGELLALIQPRNAAGRRAFYASSEQQAAADLAQAQADSENARLNFERSAENLYATTSSPCKPSTRRGRLTIRPRRASNPLKKQIQSAAAQKDKRRKFIWITRRFLRRPTASWTRAPRCRAKWSIPARPSSRLINQDDLWVRADVEETYIDRIHLGDKLQVKLPSGATREGVFFIAAWMPITPRNAT